MDALKRFSLALMAAVVVAGATPAFSQTQDTRPTEPDRPTTEQSDDGRGETRPDRPQEDHEETTDRSAETNRSAKPNLPIDITCKFGDDNGYIYLENTTGSIIPDGTVIAWSSSNGAHGVFEVNGDWWPGHSNGAHVGKGVNHDDLCDVSFVPIRKTPDKTLLCQAKVGPNGELIVTFTNTSPYAVPAGVNVGYQVWPLFGDFDTIEGSIAAGGTFVTTVPAGKWDKDGEYKGGRLDCNVFHQKNY